MVCLAQWVKARAEAEAGVGAENTDGGGRKLTNSGKNTTLTFQCLILMSTNYTIWSMRMEVLLGIHKVWEVVDSGLADAKKNDFVKGLLFQSIPEDLVLQIGNLKTEKETWEAIKTRNLKVNCVKEARLQTLITEFENLKMLDNGTIDEYAAKLSSIASKSATLEEVMSKHKMEEGEAHTLEVVDEVEIKDVFEETRKTKVVDEEVNPHSNSVHETIPESKEDKSGNDLFVTRTSLDLINEFKKRMASQFEMSNLGELTYYLGIKVSQGRDCVEIKQERYAMKILKGVGMEDCIATLCPMELRLKLSKSEDEPEVEATQYQKMTVLQLCVKQFGYAEVIENEQVIVEHVSGENQRADQLTKDLARIRFKEMRSLLGVQELPSSTQKFRGCLLENSWNDWIWLKACFQELSGKK
nr:hypothetical protein [Tanacetum cinerariifolium]